MPAGKILRQIYELGFHETEGIGRGHTPPFLGPKYLPNQVSGGRGSTCARDVTGPSFFMTNWTRNSGAALISAVDWHVPGVEMFIDAPTYVIFSIVLF
jgi:hypothetical protein